MKSAVIAALKDVASNAGDASGNADAAVSLMSHYKTAEDIDKMIIRLEWAKDQAHRTEYLARSAIGKLREFKAQGGAA